MQFRAAASVIFLIALFAYGPLGAQTTPSGILEVWLKARESADAPNTEKVSLYLKSKALVIGNDHYDGRGWPKLSNGIRDAEEVAKGLAAQGFEVTLKKDLSSNDLDRALKNFFIFEGADENTRLLIWFAGHGSTIDGEGYIVPVDAPAQKTDAQFRDKAISLRRFGEYMREAKSRHVLAIFDSCFSGSVFNVARSAPPPAITLATTQPVREFISSGDAEQQVSDDGAFRRLFLDVLAGKESDADANRDGYVTGSELGLFLHQKMTNLTSNRQTPRYGKLNALGFDRGDFVFQVGTIQAPVAPPITSTLPSSEAAVAWGVTLNTTSVAVLEEFVRQFGNTPYGPLARARLEELKKSQVSDIPPTPQPTTTTPPPPAQRPWFGVRVQTVTKEIADRLKLKSMQGAMALTVDGPAKAAGIDVDDVIIKFNGKDINESRDLARMVADLSVGADVEIVLVRNGSELRKMVRLGPLEPQTEAKQECVRLATVSDEQLKTWASQAIAACRRALELSPKDPEVMFRLGRTHRIEGNYAETQRLFRQAADLGNSNAYVGLGVLHRNGLGVAQDFREAARFFQKAADLGNPRAFDYLGHMYRNGRGVAHDEREAVRLFRKSADLGDAYGLYDLGTVYLTGAGVTRDPAEGVRLLRRSSDLGYARAMNDLGLVYANGNGVPRDIAEAQRLWRKAADLGNESAKENLAAAERRRR
jgi:TPR repeat protein